MVNIKGIIGGDITYVGFLAQLESEKKSAGKIIEIEIQSVGGYADDGLSMYYHLLDLKSDGYTIVTRCVKECASIASIVFLAGDKRICMCPLMIHNPWTTVEGDSNSINERTKELQAVEKELEEIYQTYSPLSAKVISDLMDRETYISPSEAVSLGLATESVCEVMAMCSKNINANINLKSKKMSKTNWKSLKEKLGFALGKNIIKAMQLETIGGTMLEVDREEGVPQVGDAASPVGVHQLPEGLVITVEEIDGVSQITNITEVVPEDAPVPEEMAQLIEELISENVALKANVKSEDDKRILNAVSLAGGIDKLLSNNGKVQSTYVAARRTTVAPASQGAANQSLIASKLEEARAKALEKVKKNKK